VAGLVPNRRRRVLFLTIRLRSIRRLLRLIKTEIMIRVESWGLDLPPLVEGSSFHGPRWVARHAASVLALDNDASELLF
jgi:hypothetical protein